MDTKPTIYELCIGLKKAGLLQSRRDDAFYFINPTLTIKVQDIDALKDSARAPQFVDFDALTYYPIIDDLVDNLGTDLQQIQRLSGDPSFDYFAYVEGDHLNDEAFRARGTTIWEALANVIIVRYEARKQALLDNRPTHAN